MCRYAIRSFDYSSCSCRRGSRRLRVVYCRFRVTSLHQAGLVFSFFAVSKDGTLQSQQTGVFRTNCVDCLDRTNVVQSLLAKRMLEKQLQQYSIIKAQEAIDAYPSFSSVFKNSKSHPWKWMQSSRDVRLVWADNADVVSLQYAGTGALKTDYTRWDIAEYDTE